ncbi:hypothetical protein GCM10007916_23670 [Psychromonas marina]|uniref:histidine kinase n=1 Tax=Psychromonas marina TaxID=88364 RepID=A0ABQ6E264_9GAMM|nr:PAS domain-containing hybrid sensor histidine kinase/response regulator [Psychromonas marina]GLS91298.1 hypothetical protein GCM10007916_23670 [Psychromonas marina]
MSFRLKTLQGLLITKSILFMILIFCGAGFVSEFNQAHLKQRAESTVLLFSETLKESLITHDLKTLASFTEDLLALPDISYVRISNNDFIVAEGADNEYLNRTAPTNSSLLHGSKETFDISIGVIEQGVYYGKIEIALSVNQVQQANALVKKWLFLIVCIEIIFSVIFSYLLHRYINRKNVHKEDLTDQHFVPTQASADIETVSNDEHNKNKSHLGTKQSQAHNHAILSASLDAIITIDQAGDVIDYNQVAEQTFGWRYDEIVGNNLAEFIINKDRRHAHNNGIKKFLLTKDSPVLKQRLQLTAQHKLGHSLPIEINIAPIETEQGMIFTAFIRDITSRLEAETELRLAAQTFESSEAMFISDAQGKIIRTNQAFRTITGYEHHEVEGKSPNILSSGRHPAEYYNSMWSTLVSQGKWSGEVYNKRKNGEIYPEYLNISAVIDKDQNITHYIAHFMDISEQKNTEEKLRLARSQAEASNESKSHFLASMSHEIRTPMNAVLGILDLLEESPLSTNQLTLISTARDSGELLMTIINDILDFTKMDIDEQVLQSSTFDLPHLLNNCGSLLKHLADKKSLSLNIIASEQLPRFVKGDPDRIQQILINLINNAIKFTEQGSVTLNVQLDSKQNSTNEPLLVSFQVIDTGIGIHENNQALLFEEFTMVDQTHSRKYEGTGLGLAICKRLVALMNGEIKLHSELGKGSSFEFTIELGIADENSIQQMLNKGNIQYPAENTRILLAEDNIPNQMVIKRILELSKLCVDVVANGHEAIEAVQNKQYDIILMDISMPEMDGMTATKVIRELPGAVSKIPIIALTAHTLSGDKERFLAAGMDDYLSKPIKRAATLGCIAHWTNSTAADNSEKSEMSELKSDNDSDQNYVDEKVLLQLVADTDAEIVPELITLYIEDSLERIERINTAITKEDIYTLEFETHTVGSSAAAHGNAKLYELARKVEVLCRDNQHQQALKEAKQLLDVADKSFDLLTKRAQQGFIDSTS